MFVEIFNELLEENNLNKKKFSEQSGIPYPTVMGWTNLHRLPDYTALMKIADFFHCSVDYLMGRQTDFSGTFPLQRQSAEEQRMIRSYRGLDEEGRELIHKLAERLKRTIS